ncbi:hypothetical protein ABKV19_026436 [Rosa sericea]
MFTSSKVAAPVRDKEGIPALEDVGEGVISEEKIVGRELLELLRDCKDHFMKAYDSGLDVSRMLETNMVQMLSALEEIEGKCTQV